MNVSEMSVEILSQLMLKRAGHPLSRDRQYRIESALGPVLRARQFDSIDSMVVAMVSNHDERFEAEVVEALLNNESYFFRDRAPFEMIQGYLLARMAKPNAYRRTSIWCAGVSTGQEAYSLAMMIDDHADQWRDWQIDVLGTDVSDLAIRRAKAGIYTQFEVQRGLPMRSLIRHFEKHGNDWQISNAIKSRVRFQQQDITRHHAPVFPPHDIILCRNLLLYLTPEARRLVFSRLRAALAPDGVLILGAAETILGQTDEFEPDPNHRGFYRPKTVTSPAPATATTG